MRVYNTLDGPLVIDEVGHALGGHEHADVAANPVADAHLAAGRLLQVPAPKAATAPATPAAPAAAPAAKPAADVPTPKEG